MANREQDNPAYRGLPVILDHIVDVGGFALCAPIQPVRPGEYANQGVPIVLCPGCFLAHIYAGAR